MRTPRELERLYREGKNITALLRDEQGTDQNLPEIVEIAYDLQAGSYIAALEDAESADLKRAYSGAIARTIRELAGRPASVLEAAVGEGTTLSGVIDGLTPGTRVYGFDLSWSRVAHARRWLERETAAKVELCCASLFHIPLADASVDVVYTSHSIEPNGGMEEPILRELYRVARRFVVLLEPGYELAGEEARRRMEEHGYCRDLPATCRRLGYDVIEHSLFPVVGNPLNPTALTVVRKPEPVAPDPVASWVCPRYRTPLEWHGGALFSPEALLAYPVIAGIPCLRVEHGIIASKLPLLFP